MNDVESLELQILLRDMSGARHYGGCGALDLETQPGLSAHDPQIEFRTGMGGPERTFAGLDAQSADELIDDEALSGRTGLWMGFEVRRRSKIEQRVKQAAVRHIHLRGAHLPLGDVGVPGSELPDHQG